MRIIFITFKLIGIIGFLFSALVIFSNVSNEVTDEDRQAFISEGFHPIKKPEIYDDQIKLILSLQSDVLDKFPLGEGINLFTEREPINLNQIRRGLCYDRSRYLDKLYQFYGFKTRHVYILYNTGKSLMRSMLTKGQPSHAVTQVLTSRGWLVVDSNDKFIAINDRGDPIPLEQLKEGGLEQDLYNSKFWPFIGLYSRNGAFYKPYLLVPEINLPDIFENFKEI